MKLLLDEMISAEVAVQLRVRGHDVHAVQDSVAAHLRGIDDCSLLAHAAEQRRAVVTDNVADFIRCHRRRVGRDQHHYGLLLFTNQTFPRHRHDVFVSRMVAALLRQLTDRIGDDHSSWVGWLTSD